MPLSHPRKNNSRLKIQWKMIRMIWWLVYFSFAFVVTLAPGEACEGNGILSFCLSVCMSDRMRNSKTVGSIDLILFTRSIMPMARSSSKIITQEFMQGFFTIGRQDQICHQSKPQLQTCIMMEICDVTVILSECLLSLIALCSDILLPIFPTERKNLVTNFFPSAANHSTTISTVFHQNFNFNFVQLI